MTTALWIVQCALALLFVFGGGTKLVMPIEEMTKGMPVALPAAFLRFIGVAELLCGLGLVLPGLFRIRTGLAPLAALGLVIIMAGATGLGLMMRDPVATLIPFVVGVLAAFVAYGRWRLVPHRAASPASLRPTG